MNSILIDGLFLINYAIFFKMAIGMVAAVCEILYKYISALHEISVFSRYCM
jgi:hypothetical protein